MTNAWFRIMLACMAADWGAVARSNDDLRMITKPLALVLLIGWFSSLGGWQQPAGKFFGVALVFSLLGDIFLLKRVMAANRHFFMAGMLAFMVAQTAYIFAFNRLAGPAGPILLVVLALVTMIGFINARGVIPAIRSSRSNLLAPCVIYMLVLSLMLASALPLMTRLPGRLNQALLISAGAALFYTSDSILARVNFCVPFRGSELLVMITYHIGQVLITWGALLGTIGS
jgi:uncharacterized membrane protein YhhN